MNFGAIGVATVMILVAVLLTIYRERISDAAMRMDGMTKTQTTRRRSQAALIVFAVGCALMGTVIALIGNL